MTFKKGESGTFVDEDRGLVATLVRGGPDGHSGWTIRHDDWTIEMSVWEQFPPDGETMKVERLQSLGEAPPPYDDARTIVRDFLDAYRRLPFKMKGRLRPKEIDV